MPGTGTTRPVLPGRPSDAAMQRDASRSGLGVGAVGGGRTGSAALLCVEGSAEILPGAQERNRLAPIGRQDVEHAAMGDQPNLGLDRLHPGQVRLVDVSGPDAGGPISEPARKS